MTKKRVIILFITILFVVIVGYFFTLIARGYKFDIDSLKFSPNGIIVAKSEPDGASIYINGELKGATNQNISLNPGTYDVDIKKEGFISWSKRLTIAKEEVTQITAHLFKIAPSLSPITFNGAVNPVPSNDLSKIAYVVPDDKDNEGKEGLYIMEITSLPIGFPNDPKRITDGSLEDAKLSFSPDERQILVRTKQGSYLLDTGEFVSQNQRVNIEPKLETILSDWEKDKVKIQEAQMKVLPEQMIDILKNYTESFEFSPDENMVLYTVNKETNIPENLIKQLPGSSTQKQERTLKPGNKYIYDIKEDRNFLIDENNSFLYWLPTSRHLILPEDGKISIIEYDGTNKQTVFSGEYLTPHAYPYVNSSKLLILTNLGSNSSNANLYSLTVK